ncbi:hypothetical protein GUITHDRAFT_117632 [Guillardia theta CCMP2712]|uniref:Uncharacterized protein n=1 Tax=Guillardia theta (strain CCMP2712) TaxID=905079 RepID=L1IFX7_GUITC|nr:hypothetical protein GUITHDRAFT_118965 [Guillardia theta CCMP2712]XP_005823108.1 hypothetical protein GUITHDRAFT_117632 [Guillardia theta CCMP2712]EKX34794.1 hypothetical protein GUITHDRAFT_118965 [Guillardia theta CCMP2712]EKX36128.1 hypothetical protein GUITHDRAFT_117632 [Guillardia theta CCMP2712]|eukprot:XP_005821774.1 hypothetical protein GUITHDRAFT_118965 [Guillardia theta CCMP2712]
MECPWGYNRLIHDFLDLLQREDELAMQGHSFGPLSEERLTYGPEGLRIVSPMVYKGGNAAVQHVQCVRSVFRVFCRVCHRWMRGQDWTFVAWRMLDSNDARFDQRYQQDYLLTLSEQSPRVYKNLLICIRKPRSSVL